MGVFKKASQNVERIIREEITEPERREREEARRRQQRKQDGGKK